MSTKIAMLLLGFASANFCCSQAFAQEASGKVVSESGGAVQGVKVYGATWTCCPSTVKSTMTKANGTFSLTQPGPVLHFRGSGLQPLSLVIGKDSFFTMVMKSQQSTVWAIPTCRAKEQLRFGQTFLFLRRAGEPLAKGQDVDYARFGSKAETVDG
jgi:hypothetical protein